MSIEIRILKCGAKNVTGKEQNPPTAKIANQKSSSKSSIRKNTLKKNNKYVP